MRRRPTDRPARGRRGVAAIELAAVAMFFMVPLMFAVWETGRLIQVQQVVSNSAREGARLAAQAYTVNSSGDPIQIKVSTGTPNVHDVVYQYLVASGLTNLTSADVYVEFAFTDGRTTAYIPGTSDPAGTSYPVGSKPSEPCYGSKNQKFTVYVRIPWDKVRWINVGILQPQYVYYTVAWQMLIDDQFTITDAVPVN